MKGNLVFDYPADFLALWRGCSDQDCLPQCRHGEPEQAYCERLEREWNEYQDAMEASVKGNCCYIERSAVREIIIASDANNEHTAGILADIDALEIVTTDQFEREIQRLRGLTDRLKLEAQCHAQEARTANATIAEVYQVVTRARGEPGNWNGAKPVREEIDRLLALLKESNEICRSTYQIAARGGKETNWPAFTQRVGDLLDKQHAVLFPPETATCEDTDEVCRTAKQS